MTFDAYNYAYKCLSKIYSDKAYSGIELNNILNECKTEDKPLITKLVYGVLDNDIKCEYILKQFASSVKSSVKVLMKLGIYSLLELSIGAHTVINTIVELSKKLGKGGVSGFINSTLRAISVAISSKTICYPINENEFISVHYSLPLWMVNKLIKQYGLEQTKQILSFKPDFDLTHIRINPLFKDKFNKVISDKRLTVTNSVLSDCCYINNGDMADIDSRFFTIQSLGSCLVCNAASITDNLKVLDVCSAPGGKAIYMAQMADNVEVTACDYLPHRVNLIKSYANRLGVNLKIELNDATVLRKEWIDSFDLVLADVPCSGLGIIYSKPDIKLFRNESDLVSLMKLQEDILQNCSKYVKAGGVIIYSTCTIINEENINVINGFINCNSNFSLEEIKLPLSNFNNNNGTVQLLPNNELNEGFFIARLRRLT